MSSITLCHQAKHQNYFIDSQNNSQYLCNWDCFCLWIKSCPLQPINKMLIRHITIPRRSHLVALSQPKEPNPNQQQDDTKDYFTKTLNPEQPIMDILSSAKGEQSFSDLSPLDKRGIQRSQSQLTREQPLPVDEFQPDLHLSPRKQNYFKHLNQFNQQKPQKGENIHRGAYFSAFASNLNNQAYLEEKIVVPAENGEVEVSCKKEEGEDYEEEAIAKKQPNIIVQNREVYRTLQRFKAKNSQRQFEDASRKGIKKYNFNPLTPEPKRNNLSEQSYEQKRIQKRGQKLQPIPREGKGYFSNPMLPQSKKKQLPIEQQAQQSPLISLKRIRPKPKSVRKASEQQKIPIYKNYSQINVINKQQKRQKIIAKSSGQLIQQISYRTSLTKLKDICLSPSTSVKNISIKIPEIFSYPYFSGEQTQQQLFHKAEEVLKHLQAPRKQVSLKKYSNCVVIIAGHLAVIWHFSGKVYFGGWKNHILDEGCKHGLGLQWYPKKYVYYGQFLKNKREGVGIMKNSENEIVVGKWCQNRLVESYRDDEDRMIGRDASFNQQ